MFGQSRLQKIIRENAGQSSASIKNAIIAFLQNFRQNTSQEDDITLVAVKLL
jgi:serine phosphatase RsbU (regulator of sigma subunit)